MKKETKKYPRYYREGKTYKLTEKEKKQMVLLRKKRETLKSIAQKFDISWQAVSYWVNEDERQRVKERSAERHLFEDKKGTNARKLQLYYEKFERQPKEMEIYYGGKRIKIIKRIKELERFLADYKFQINQHKHLDKDTPERIYWHFGYLMACKDILKLYSKIGTKKQELRRT